MTFSADLMGLLLQIHSHSMKLYIQSQIYVLFNLFTISYNFYYFKDSLILSSDVIACFIMVRSVKLALIVYTANRCRLNVDCVRVYDQTWTISTICLLTQKTCNDGFEIIPCENLYTTCCHFNFQNFRILKMAGFLFWTR